MGAATAPSAAPSSCWLWPASVASWLWPAAPAAVLRPVRAASETDGSAIAALVLAIASFVVCPVIPAIVALFLASNAKKNIAASGGTLTGESLAQVATIVSWINVGLGVLGLVVTIIVVAVAASTDSRSALALVTALS